MKKTLLTFIAFAAFAMTTNAQANLFAAEDIDADGWLWFDTQAKIDKYVSVGNEDDNKVDPNGKLVQILYADLAPDYPAPTTDPTVKGAGTDGDLGTDGCKTGAIILPASSAVTNYNGGRFVICMPDGCTSLSICYSCESYVYCRLSSSNNVDATCVANTSETFDANKYSARAIRSLFNKLSSYGVNTWSGMETLNNNMLDGCIKGESAVYAMFESGTKSEIYIHGIKALTAKTTGISNVNAAESSEVSGVYDMQGKLVAKSADGLSKGLYIVKTGKNAKKVVVK